MLTKFQFTHPGKGATYYLIYFTTKVRSFNSRTLGRVRPFEPYELIIMWWFQFTHPGKGATGGLTLGIAVSEFQFTHPGKGATKPARANRRRSRVSIHAPWEGCDLSKVRTLTTKLRFQFTHPGKGATSEMGYTSKNLRVSIHAPWEGCDTMQRLSNVCESSFNSRTLGRVRLTIIITVTVMAQFQFTHPGKGATRSIVGATRRRRVSIHAPWEGCDGLYINSTKRPTRFNSRTLGRVRLSSFIPQCQWGAFQFTHPGKGATDPYTLFETLYDVSIHAPWEGCDRCSRL